MNPSLERRMKRRAPERSWDVVLNRALFAMGALWISLQSIPVALAVVAMPPQPVLAVVAATALSQLTIAVLCVRAMWSIGPRLVALGYVAGFAAIAAGASLTWVDHDFGRSSELMVPTNAVQAFGLFAVLTSRGLLRPSVIMAIGTAVYFGIAARDGISGEVVEQWGTPTMSTVATAALAMYLRSGADYARELADWNRQARHEAARTAADSTAMAAARRVIHDDVLSALRAVAQGAPAQPTVAASRSALGALDALSSCAGRQELLDELSRFEGIDVEIVDDAWAVEPPSRVLEAMRSAALEALRNVQRHSGMTSAVVTVQDMEGACQLTVVDGGVGIWGGGG